MISRAPRFASLLAALALLAAASLPVAASAAQRVVQLPALGPGSGSGVVFVDVMQQASPWISGDGSRLQVDADGNLEGLFPHQSADRIVFTNERYPAGDYTLLWQGKAIFQAFGGTLLPGGGPNRLVLRVGPNAGAGLRLRLTATDPGDVVRDVRLILPGFERVAGQVTFAPSFLRSVLGADVIDFSRWANSGTYADSAVWPGRARVMRPTQAMPNGVAYEYEVLLANLTGASPLLAMPVGATDGYVDQMAQKVHRTLDPSLHTGMGNDAGVYSPGSPTNGWALMAGRNLHIPGDAQSVARTWYANRFAQTLSIFRQEFGSDAYRVMPAGSSSFALVRRGRANPNARLILGDDEIPFVNEHVPPVRPAYRPNAARPLAARETLDLHGLPGVAIGLGEQLDRVDLAREGTQSWVSADGRTHAAGGISYAWTGRGYSLVAPADRNERVLRVYAGATNGLANLTATLEGKLYHAQSIAGDSETNDGVWTLVYRATRPGRIVVSVARQSGNLTFGGATLAAHDLRGKHNTSPTDEALYHNDLLRTGWNPNETLLTTGNVASSFGKIGTFALDGNVLAQPLYLAGVTIGSVSHNVIVIGTENASVYEFDADSGAQIGYVSLGTAASSNDIGCGDITPKYGVTATPVVNRATNTLYIVSVVEPTKGAFAVVLHALDLGTLADQVAPVDLTATTTLSNGSKITFDPQNQHVRDALVWANNSLYLGVGSHCDNNAGATVGWVLRYDVNLNQLAAWPTIEDSQGYLLSSIWQSGFGPAVSKRGDLYFITGNGAYDANSKGGRDYGESVVRITSDLSTVKSSFTPHEWQSLNNGDVDFGSGGVMLLPPAKHVKDKQVAVAMGKSSKIYLLNAMRLGKESLTDKGALQVFSDGGGGVWGGPTYFSGPTGQFVYYQSGGNTMHAYLVQRGSNGIPQLSLSSTGSSYGGYGGSTPVISSNGQTPGTAILWEIERGNGQLFLEAYDATNLATMLYQTQAGTWPSSNGFVTPLVADGKVYVPGQAAVTVYGLTTR